MERLRSSIFQDWSFLLHCWELTKPCPVDESPMDCWTTLIVVLQLYFQQIRTSQPLFWWYIMSLTGHRQLSVWVPATCSRRISTTTLVESITNLPDHSHGRTMPGSDHLASHSISRLIVDSEMRGKSRRTPHTTGQSTTGQLTGKVTWSQHSGRLWC